MSKIYQVTFTPQIKIQNSAELYDDPQLKLNVLAKSLDEAIAKINKKYKGKDESFDGEDEKGKFKRYKATCIGVEFTSIVENGKIDLV